MDILNIAKKMISGNSDKSEIISDVLRQISLAIKDKEEETGKPCVIAFRPSIGSSENPVMFGVYVVGMQNSEYSLFLENQFNMNEAIQRRAVRNVIGMIKMVKPGIDILQIVTDLNRIINEKMREIESTHKESLIFLLKNNSGNVNLGAYSILNGQPFNLLQDIDIEKFT